MSTVKLLALAILPTFLLIDLVMARRRGRAARSWRWRATAVTVFNFSLSLVIGKTYAAAFGGMSLFDGRTLGPWLGAVVGVLVYDLGHYAYHRAAHRFGWLWRLGHQMHHSAESLDPWGAYFLHPLDAAMFISLSNLVLTPLLGLDPLAAASASAFITFCAVFQHASVKTPRWLGWFVQRPESHAVHHARGVHAGNYANLPLWDLLFGTCRNPRHDVPPQQGFYDGASSRLLDMLAFRDVSRPATPKRSVGSP
jgi:sterol desaturase/sphingolipid hydroxylase (fatty acid hydroxylase superfamily)